ncbi:DUF6458 family protein [Kribbella turkmenica]|uniref:DUF6458 family protein n=1 Tax=Kribbella turkmenica TaxID=2530375 RepID=UPI00192DA81B|nr:DUF6458 family protein [Kribbella turkmenica]
MSIGAGIFLIAAGAILAFGIRDDSGTVDLNVIGVIVMLAGAAGIWLSYYITNQRRRVQTQALDPAVEEEYRSVEESSAAHREAQAGAETPTERRIELDPAASGLHTPAPDRARPVNPEPAEPRGATSRRRILHRFRDRR